MTTLGNALALIRQLAEDDGFDDCAPASRRLELSAMDKEASSLGEILVFVRRARSPEADDDDVAGIASRMAADAAERKTQPAVLRA